MSSDALAYARARQISAGWEFLFAPAAARAPVSSSRAIAGISGGRTSGFMAKYLRNTERGVVFSFQNTGEEHPATYDFIDRLEQDLQHEIVRLEFRAPERGLPPRFATFEVVEHRHLSRNGEPFDDMLACVNAFRATKGLGPVGPWARSRICTAYLKIRTQRKWCASKGWGHQRDYTEYVGLRADEPLRVARMRERNATLDTDERAPLADTGVTKSDVLRFWSKQPYDLTWENPRTGIVEPLPEHLGNCTKCFLKDEADLATAMIDHPGDNERWVARDKAVPMRRGRSSYEQVLAEAPDRMEIRAALAEGRAYTVSLPSRRIQLIVRQELSARQSFSCECDAAKADDDEDQLSLFDLGDAA